MLILSIDKTNNLNGGIMAYEKQWTITRTQLDNVRQLLPNDDDEAKLTVGSDTDPEITNLGSSGWELVASGPTNWDYLRRKKIKKSNALDNNGLTQIIACMDEHLLTSATLICKNETTDEIALASTNMSIEVTSADSFNIWPGGNDV